MTDQELLQQQDILQQEAYEVLEKLQLETFLSHFGEFVIEGSVITGLMTWRDIDVAVRVRSLPTREILQKVAGHFLSYPQVVGVNIMDNTPLLNPHHPKGIYCGLKYQTKEGNIWKIDLWFVTCSEEVGLSDVSWLQECLTDETRLVILRIKQAIHGNPKYKKTIFSVDIYKAVLEEGVHMLEEFEDYLKRTNRQL